MRYDSSTSKHLCICITFTYTKIYTDSMKKKKGKNKIYNFFFFYYITYNLYYYDGALLVGGLVNGKSYTIYLHKNIYTMHNKLWQIWFIREVLGRDRNV